MTFPPTAEQQAALDAFATGESMVIEAGAGTGKTTTLRLLAEATDRKGIYLAYNKAIQTDADKSFPTNAKCKTAHALAYGGMMRSEHTKALMRRLNGPRVPSRQAVAILGIPAAGFQISDEQRIDAWVISRSAMETVQKFCNSADEEITTYHVRRIPGVEDHAAYASYVLPFARKAWADLNSTTGRLSFQHDHYLKIWALTNPKLNCEWVFLDEAQDANPVIAKLVGDQSHAQQVMVGDRCQAIYGWRGAVDAMSNFDCKHHLMLSQSFRFGDAVATEANKWLDLLEAPLRLSGFSKILSRVAALTDPDAILCRTNAAVIQYAMDAQENGKKVAIVGGTSEIEKFTKAAQAMQSGQSVSHPDLVAFKTWGDVVEYANSDEGSDLKVMVKLIVDYGIDAILEVCATSVDEKGADLIVSTAHKAKGREWNHVLVANDFPEPKIGELPSRAEMMLAYVTVTRAKETLDNSGLSWIDNLKGA